MKNISALLLFLLASQNLQAQIFERLNAPVIKDDTPMRSPWAGGVNAPQWSAADLNNDGKMDLYAFDRDGSVHLTFLNAGETGDIRYEYAPEYLSNFPSYQHFALLRDYDQDGDVDIFAHAGDEGVAGIKVYDGFYENGELRFERLTMPHFALDVLTSKLSSGDYTNLNVSSPDYPSVEDVDGDGDLDITALFSTTGNTLVYYQNLALEQGFFTDTLIFQRMDNCWLKVFIPTLTTSLDLSCSPDSCANECAFAPNAEPDDRTGGAHGASTLLTYDFDNDGDSELLYGDLQYPNVIYLENNKDSGTDWAVVQDSTFPSYDIPVDLPNFPASFNPDIDNDGTIEFMFSPNTFGATIRDHNNVFFYENTGTNEIPILEKQTDNLIVRDMIDVGTAAQPAFFDHNADGLMDFVVGNFTAWTPSGQDNESFFQLFENTGTSEQPEFTLVDENYLNFIQFSSVATGFAPTFGDLDNDGDQDLLVGQKDGTLFFVENTAGPGSPVTWGPVQPNWKVIDVGQNAAPCIFDVDDDGLPDLLIGHKLGTVVYFKNIGTPGAPEFDPDLASALNNVQLGGIDTQDQSTTNQGMSAPTVLDFGDTTYLVVGGESGYLEVYLLDRDSLGTAQLFPQVSEQFFGLYEGTYSRTSFANLNDDEYLDMLLGNHRGGLSLFTSPFKTDGLMISAAGEEKQMLDFEIHPNPTDDLLHLRWQIAGLSTGRFRLFSPVGQMVLQGEVQGPEQTIGVGHLAAGLYFLELRAGGLSSVKKIIVK